MRCRIIIRAGAAIFPFFFHADQGRGGRVENEAETRGWRVFAKSFAQPLRETDGGGGRMEREMTSCAWSVLPAIFISAAFRVFRPAIGFILCRINPGDNSPRRSIMQLRTTVRINSF